MSTYLLQVNEVSFVLPHRSNLHFSFSVNRVQIPSGSYLDRAQIVLCTYTIVYVDTPTIDTYLFPNTYILLFRHNYQILVDVSIVYMSPTQIGVLYQVLHIIITFNLTLCVTLTLTLDMNQRYLMQLDYLYEIISLYTF